jgi:hypothetical protein
MKRWMVVLVFMLGCPVMAGNLAVVGTVAESPSMQVDMGFGGELQYRQPVQGDLYLLGLAGVTYYGVEDQQDVYGNKCVTIYDSLTGSVNDVYVGLGAGVQQQLPWAGLLGRLEASVQYHFLDSSVNEIWDVYGHHWSCHRSQGYDIDNTWTIGIGTQLVKPITDKVSVVGGVGYRFDLDDQRFSNSDVGFSLDGFVGSVGLEINL